MMTKAAIASPVRSTSQAAAKGAPLIRPKAMLPSATVG
jgi:hypothetical protein